MKDIFKINKHIKDWENCQNLYNRITGELTAEAINWYKNRSIAEIWADCILAWNKDHLRSCKSVTALETSFLERVEKPCARDPRSPVPLTLAVQNSLTL